MIATLRSFRTTKLSDLVAFGRPEAKLGARVLKDDLVRVYELDIAPGSRKVRLDGKVPRPLARYFGGFNVVVFTPEDLALPRGSPGDRRRFLDRGVFNFDPSYLSLATDYEKVLRSRNAVLKQAGQGLLGGTKLEDMLLVYDAQLARLSVQVVNARTRFLSVLRPALVETFTRITRTGLVAGARYSSRIAELASQSSSSSSSSATPSLSSESASTTSSSSSSSSSSATPSLSSESASTTATPSRSSESASTSSATSSRSSESASTSSATSSRSSESASTTTSSSSSSVAVPDAALVTLVEQKLRDNRVKDLATQSTQLGPHRDDVVLELEGREAGSFASQGQLRAIMLAWKTAELRVLGDAHGDQPILLLDDVSSELDPSRNEFLFDHLATLAGQCFITTTHQSHVLLAQNRADYCIQAGRILE